MLHPFLFSLRSNHLHRDFLGSEHIVQAASLAGVAARVRLNPSRLGTAGEAKSDAAFAHRAFQLCQTELLGDDLAGRVALDCHSSVLLVSHTPYISPICLKSSLFCLFYQFSIKIPSPSPEQYGIPRFYDGRVLPSQIKQPYERSMTA